MSAKIKRPFGLWESPFSPKSLAQDKRLEAGRYDSDGRTLVWLEGRSGKGVLLAQSEDGQAPRELTSDLSVRAEVGYGGGDFTVHGGAAYFAVEGDGRLFRQSLSGGPPRAITPSFGSAAAPVVSPDGKWVAYVHQDDGRSRLAVVDSLGRAWPRILVEGDDFHMQPRWSPDGSALAWIAWRHPLMPWDGTRLHWAPRVEREGLPRLGESLVIAGGDQTSVFQPEFGPDGDRLYFVSDESGWGRIAEYRIADGARRWLTDDGIEFSAPAWTQDLRTYAIDAAGRAIYAVSNRAGFHRLGRIDIETAGWTDVPELSESTEILQLTASTGQPRLAMIAASSTTPPRLLQWDVEQSQVRVVARASGEMADAASLARCEAISWSTGQGETAHGLFYRAASDRFESDGKPPLIVHIHGGPTSQERAGWKSGAQFFATRGYAVLFVNYRGSTGYGRDYMTRLRGMWGVCDVEDSISGADHLAEIGEIDRRRCAIMGGSAGGFTVLQTMTTRPEAFAAGVNLFGVADQLRLAQNTHKFESRYLDSLLGPLPESAALYRERSPALHAERIDKPLAVFQGSIDRVVPQEQSDAIVSVLRRRNVPHLYHVYEGEGHGWRRSDTIEHYYQAVDAFLREHLVYGS